MSKLIDLNEIEEYNLMSDFSKYLIEQGYESKDFFPVHFCLIAVGHSEGGGDLYYSSMNSNDSGALIHMVGILESVKYDAFRRLEEIDANEE